MTSEPASLILASGCLGPVPFEDRVRAAAEGGFDGIGLSIWEYLRLRGSGYTDDTLQAILRDFGSRVIELEVAMGFDAPDDERGSAPASGLRFAYLDDEIEQSLFRMADVFGSRHLIAVGTMNRALDPGRASEAFGRLCDRAARHDLLVALEFLPIMSVADAGEASRIVRECGRENAGICVDSWHHVRGRNDPELLTAVPGDRVWVVQINDGPAQPSVPDWAEETMQHRRVPGRGDFDLVGLLRLLRGMGVAAPLGVEVLAGTPVAPDAAGVGRLLGDATRAVLERAWGTTV